MAAVYWLGAPGVSQLEYPPGSATFYNVGDYIPVMTEDEARALTPLGHNFEIPNVFPYGTPEQIQPAPQTTRRVGIAVRTGEPESAAPGMIIGGPAPQAMWSTTATAASREAGPNAFLAEGVSRHDPPPPPAPPSGMLVTSAANQSEWSQEDLEPTVVAVAVSSAGRTVVAADVGTQMDDAVVAVAIADPEAETPAETTAEAQPEETAVEPPLEELPEFTSE